MAVPSNGGLICTVFSSIFICRLALSLKSDIDRNATYPRENTLPFIRTASPAYSLSDSILKHSNALASNAKVSDESSQLVPDKQVMPTLAKAYIHEGERAETPFSKLTVKRSAREGSAVLRWP